MKGFNVSAKKSQLGDADSLSDIFARVNASFTTSFRARAAIASWSSMVPTGDALLTLEIVVSSSQMVTKVYELNTSHTYYTAGRAKGNWKVSRAFATRPAILEFYCKFTPPCPSSPNLNVQTRENHKDDPQPAPHEWTMCHVELIGVGCHIATAAISTLDQVSGQFEGLNLPKNR
jgi:hypothetical protein